MDAIQVIKKDHATVERLFKDFERADRAGKKADLRRVVRSLIKELSVHAVIEEQLLYPTLRRLSEEVEDEVLEGLEEHHLVKVTLDELDAMGPDDERYRPKVRVLIESVRHHVHEEEHELLPRLKKGMATRDLRELGEALETLKKAAPTRPHPAAPDTPPGNLVAGPMAAVLDRGRDMLRGVAERGRERARQAAERGRERARDAARQARGRVASKGRGGRSGGRARGAESSPTVH